jgi:hypothetical protein
MERTGEARSCKVRSETTALNGINLVTRDRKTTIMSCSVHDGGMVKGGQLFNQGQTITMAKP